MKRVLFVCTGNTCRSPMAQGLMNQFAQQHGLDVQATSAGIAADESEPISKNAALSLEEEGIDMSYHRARQLCKNDISNANAIFCMTRNHMLAVLSLYPESTEKLYLFEEEIGDPFGGGIEMYRRCRDEIATQIPYVCRALGEKVR